MKNVQKMNTQKTEVQMERMKEIGCKIVDFLEMLIILTVAALLLIVSAVSAKAEPITTENNILPGITIHIAEAEGEVNTETLELTDRILNALPEKLLMEFKESDWKLYVTANVPVLTYFSGVYGVPNGRPDLEAHYIEVVDDQETLGKSILHEFGHYVDYAKGDVSLKSEFSNIYAKEYKSFTKEFGIDIEGYDQPEFFADAFAKFYSGYSRQMMENYPDLCGYIKTAISGDNVSRKVA